MQEGVLQLKVVMQGKVMEKALGALMVPIIEVPVAQVKAGLCMVQSVTSGILAHVLTVKTVSVGMFAKLVPSPVSLGSNTKLPHMKAQGTDLGYSRNSHQLL